MADKLVYKLQDIKEDKNTNLKPENLKVGVTCLGVVGIMQPGIDTSDATATANDIVNGKTAYINGEKVTGTIKALTSANHTLLTPTALEDEDNEVRLRLETTNRRYTLSGTPTSVYVKQDALADVIGLTADKIKAGETILGVTGTYTGEIDTSL